MKLKEAKLHVTLQKPVALGQIWISQLTQQKAKKNVNKRNTAPKKKRDEDSSSALAAHNEYVANISESLKSVARNQLDEMRVMCENHRRTNSLLEELISILKNYFAVNPISSTLNQESSVQHESVERVERVEDDIQPMRSPSPTNPDPINEVDENEEIEEMEILEDEVDFEEIMRHNKKSKY
ncbi:uncharacterized protein LOC116417082 [Nasonia vitripennis]|uniref:Uncharacterized protein n=1 Tax=Nasonia vitripennis TaxID=7425 RepID=A0A7M7T968_NASVI|nr:uncharacterized protein LOC116417082 [Nasonia vitripennis]XP_031784072.1 uncharacterized protein LOC116417082 [Nasonia vitripennis]XP_031784073.1 uncharacterized protein LOC116417082 [Nasonia vitripennis]XP_032457817.1 uncharacterized protein LOC116417082 [Nasonia vitripennis]XP_032457818.1 uncharacterized protein LOC116417082 [Nasonia vitripennis]